MENQSTELSTVVGSDLTRDMAALYRVPPAELVKTIKAQCFPAGAASDAQLTVFLTVCRERGLNPFMKEVYVFMQGNKMQIGVEVDGWIRKAQEHPQYDGFEAIDEYGKDGKILAVTCKIFRKDWKRHGEYRALFSEWHVPTSAVWSSKPRHMLFVKAFNEAARFSLGLTGISDRIDQESMTVTNNGRVEETGTSEHEEAEIVNEESGEVVGATPPAEVRAQESAQNDSAGDERGAAQPASTKDVPAGTDAATAQTEREVGPSPDPAPKPKGRPKSAKTRLKELSKDVAPNRMVVLLGQMGVAKLDDLTEEQAAEAVTRLERRGK